jgi:TatD DNase family protein
MPALIDIGVNLAHESFDADRDQVVAAAMQAGVTRLIVTGTSVTASARAAELAGARPGVLYHTAGVHPHHAAEFDEHSGRALTALLTGAGAVAVGECGLDYFRDFAPRDRQRETFRAQLEIAAATGLPVFLHQRDALDDFIAILTEYRPHLAGGVAHCFTEGPGALRRCLDLDLFVGITGWVCDDRRGQPLRDALPGMPLNRLLVETDAPYLLPRDLHPAPKTRRNEPRYLPHVVARIAALLQQPIDQVERATTANAEALFGLSVDAAEAPSASDARA